MQYTSERDNCGVLTEPLPARGKIVPSAVWEKEIGDKEDKLEKSLVIWCEAPESKTQMEEFIPDTLDVDKPAKEEVVGLKELDCCDFKSFCNCSIRD